MKIGTNLDAILTDLKLSGSASDDYYREGEFWFFSLVSILQYWEDLDDQQMAYAARVRPDLKYALHLPMDYPGFEPVALCVFRQRILFAQAGKEAFQEIVDHLKLITCDHDERQWDAGQITTALCLLSRAATIIETMNNALEAIAVQWPDWLLTSALPHWYKRYYQKPGPQQIPRKSEEITDLLQTVGRDGQYLLQAIDKSGIPQLGKLPEIQRLFLEWKQQYRLEDGSLKLLFSNFCSSCTYQK